MRTQAEQLKLRTTTDHAEIKKVLCHPEIYPLVSCDDSPSADEFTPPDGPIYLIGELVKTGEIIGLFVLHQHGGFDWWCHFQVLPEYRKEYAIRFGKKCGEYAFSEVPNCKKLLAQIPVIYGNVVMFAQKCGFKFEGMNRQSYYKNGKCYDQHYMGLLPWDL